jgi:hypothetical protein
MNSDLMPIPIDPTAIYTKTLLTTSTPLPGDISELLLAMLCIVPILLDILDIHLSVLSLGTNNNPDRK